jgi:hypothetical protein
MRPIFLASFPFYVPRITTIKLIQFCPTKIKHIICLHVNPNTQAKPMCKSHCCRDLALDNIYQVCTNKHHSQWCLFTALSVVQPH